MPRRRGRPRLDPTDPSVPLTFHLPSRQADRLQQLALHYRVSVPTLVRCACRRLLKAADLSRQDEQP